MTVEEDSSDSKCGTVPRKAVVTVAVLIFLVVAAAIALVIGLFVSKNSQVSDGGDGHHSSDGGHLACADFENIPDMWAQCRTGIRKIRSIPSCVEEMHAALRETLAAYLPDDLEINHCDPTNMALLSMADATTYFNPAAAATPHLIERFALTALYFSSQGNDWYHTSQWLSGVTHCAWHGITCDTNGRVVEIDMNMNNLQGRLPSELALLTDLKVLKMDNGDIAGSIPSEIYGKLSNLEHLSLVGNVLTGISPEIGNLRSLKVLSLDNNKFVATTLPTELGLLSTLTSISCTGCRLQGTIPAELRQCSNLSFVHLDANFLSGTLPPELSSTLTFLGVANNNLAASPFPSSLFRLTKLTALRLSGNAFEGPAFPPEMFTSLSNLRSFGFSGMSWTGTIPTEITLLGSTLESLSVGRNRLNGTIPSEMGGLTRLKYLHLESNELTGSLPSELGKLTDMMDLYLDGNPLDVSDIPTELASLASENGFDLPRRDTECC